VTDAVTDATDAADERAEPDAEPGASGPAVGPAAGGTDVDAGAEPPDAEQPDAEPPDAEQPEPSHPTFVRVEVMSVSFELSEASPTIHLREPEMPFRGIDFPIGLPEAQAIARALEGERPARPSTHDLLATTLAAAGCDLVAVRITGAKAGTIYAELDLVGPRGREVVDCRPTDGIAVALRIGVTPPILCDAALLE